jgi:pyruvate, water dikinase
MQKEKNKKSIIVNKKDIETTPLRRDALSIAEAGYSAIETKNVIEESIIFHKDTLTISGKVYAIKKYERIFCIALGKCAYDAGHSVENVLGKRLDGGIVYDIQEEKKAFSKMKYLKGTHPYASVQNSAHSKEVCAFLENTTEKDFIIFIISGGSSALLTYPKYHTAREEIDLIHYLFKAGATIYELNIIRKHCSLARGGHLAFYAQKSDAVSLIFSDVPNDDIYTIASGPTVYDSSTLDDALSVFRKYKAHRSGFKEEYFFETPKEKKIFQKMRIVLSLTNKKALTSMAEHAEKLGYRPLIRDTALIGEAEKVGTLIAEELHMAKEGTALLYGGETTVKIKQKSGISGKGGRNQEVSLSALRSLKNDELVLSLASDGFDNTPYAGGIADKETKKEAEKKFLDIENYLNQHNSHSFFHTLRQGVETGYTGSNIADFIIALKAKHNYPLQKNTMPHTHNPEYIIWYKDLSIEDVPKVGGKNAALGEMVKELLPLGVRVPNGFALTSLAYHYFLDSTGLRDRINEALLNLDTHDTRELAKRGEMVREMILKEELPEDLKTEIAHAYLSLVEMEGAEDVAVRSSATAEDLPGASFAGQQETYLNVVGVDAVILSAKKCIASLFTNRAISYRFDKGFSHTDAALSVGIQKMVRSDLSVSGVMFSIDTETGFDKVIVIEGAYGLGEMVVQGKVTPDSYTVFKPSLEKGLLGVIARDIGPKEIKMIYDEQGGKIVDTSEEERNKLCLSDEEVSTLAKYALIIEKHFSKKHEHYQPMDMEWAKDGKTGELYIVQARPETVISMRDKTLFLEYSLKGKGNVLTSGTAVGAKIASGPVHIIKDVENIHDFKKGEVLVTEITDPDWEPIMKIASAIVTNKGGRTSHAAIVSRELGIPCIVGCVNATEVLQDGQEVTIDCATGKTGEVLEGRIPFEEIEHHLDALPTLKTKVMVNIGSPEEAFKNTHLPVEGVGLGRLEFIIMSHIRVHPNALIEYDTLKWYAGEGQTDKQELVKEIDILTKGYTNKTDFYVDELAEGIAKIAAAFYPRNAIIRFSDFKTNEYRTLLGGYLYEPEEENPMIGWRGASRYYDESFKKAFGLECRALLKVRKDYGLDNVIPMIPFCRTLEEADKVLSIMAEYDLSREKGVPIYMMCEIPANVLLAEEFLEKFDGFSIGSNDLTQLVLGMDRDNDHIAHIGNENNEAVKRMLSPVIEICKKKNKYIGICGQGPSDFPEFAQFLVKLGIQSLSFTPDTVIKTLPKIAEAESEVGK